jgi:hypothetical protein
VLLAYFLQPIYFPAHPFSLKIAQKITATTTTTAAAMGGSQQDYQSEDSNSLGKSHETKPSDAPVESQTDGGANTSKQTRSWRFWLTMFALFLGMFVANLDATIVGE